MPIYQSSYLAPASLAPVVQITQGPSFPTGYTVGKEFILTVASGLNVPGLYILSTITNSITNVVTSVWQLIQATVPSGTSLPSGVQVNGCQFYLTAASGSHVVGVYTYSTITSLWALTSTSNPNTFLIPVAQPTVVTPPYLVEDIYLKGGARVVANEAALYTLDPAVLKTGMLIVTQNDNKIWQLNSNGTFAGTYLLPSIANCTDATILQPTTGQLLQFNGSAWVNKSVTITGSISNLTDVALSTLNNGQVLEYHNGKWVNVLPAEGSIESLGDVAVTNPTAGTNSSVQ